MNELQKQMMCIQMRGQVLIWVDKERAENLIKILESENKSKFIRIDNQVINTFDIIGIFNPQTMETAERLKRGEWQCQKGHWQPKGNKKCDQCYF